MRSGRARSRGMTLIELMIVVAIVGVLATLATVGYSRWIASSRMAEATNMVASIKNAQENYLSQAGRYLDVSKGLEPPNLFPAKTPGPTRTAWEGDCSVCNTPDAWKRLAIRADKPVYFGYATVAGEGDPDARGVTFSTSTGAVNWKNEAGGAVVGPYYMVSAVADTNGNGKYAKVLGTSFGGRLIVDGEGE